MDYVMFISQQRTQQLYHGIGSNRDLLMERRDELLIMVDDW